MSQVEVSAGKLFKSLAVRVAIIASTLIVTACATLPPAPKTVTNLPRYHIGAGDALSILVWQNSDLTTKTTVRPDGMISMPLIHDIRAAGKTPTQLSRDIQRRLTKYVTKPVVTVMVNSFVGQFSEQIRVVGEAAKPQTIPYRKGMTALDAMIAVGGLSQFADGNRATLVRRVHGKEVSYRLHLDDLLQDGEISANVPLKPGDVIIIPQTYI
jgi:polysaccharide biosynthesis/export protein